MEATTLPFYRLEFAKRADWRRDEERRQFEFNRKTEKERKEDEREEKAEIEEASLSVLATSVELTKFNVRLDAYDTATVEALMENGEQMELVKHQLDAMLGEAYVLPDGRRVFKTEDGLRVFDEHGIELSAKDIDPTLIDDRKPRWESYDASVKAYQGLTDERQQLLDYQDELDTVHDRLKAGKVTADELKAMDADLRANLPDAAKKLLPKDMLDSEPAADNRVEGPKPAFRPGVALDMPAL